MSSESKLVLYTPNRMKGSKAEAETALFAPGEVDRAVKFLETAGAEYNVTPLVGLGALAKRLGVDTLFVKDESRRGSLKAFKLLGGAYAVANILCEKLGVNLGDVDFEYLKSAEVKGKLGDIVFAAASDGNHGKAVAWAASRFGHRAVVYMPKGTAADRIEAIESFGGTVVVSEYSYDWCVREVGRLADEKGWVVVPDTASEGNAQVSAWVMQGYSVMAREVAGQMGSSTPTHVFLQAGVGSFAGAITAALHGIYGERCPKIYTLEPHTAACFYRSGLRADGQPESVEGELDSIMAGLACGVPNPIGWKIMQCFADGFFSCADVLSANGMRILGNPLAGDERVVSGESGAIGTGFLEHVMTKRKDIADGIGLGKDSVVMLFSTEGDTDAKNYRDVVWHGKYPYNVK